MDPGIEMASQPSRQITGRHVFAALVCFFGVIIAVNVTLAVLAKTSWTGLVVENGYVASQAFNRDLAEARRQADLGWREEFGYRNGLLELRIADADGRALERLVVSVKLERPSTDKDDRQLALSETRTGTYTVPIALKSGQWDADVTARAASGEAVRRIYRFHVAQEG